MSDQILQRPENLILKRDFFKEELSKLPEKPGVYIMKDESGKVLYVGKAAVLKNRVRQYFQDLSRLSLKIRAMVSQIAVFEYFVAASELEALILECNLIKKYKPKYNFLLKDDKTYPYIKVTMNEEYPRVLVTRRLESDGARYYGPYSGAGKVREALDLLRAVFPMKTCAKVLPRDIGKSRPCLNYQIYRCPGPCAGGVGAEEYREVMSDVCAFLDGRQEEVLKKLEISMNRAADELKFEKAAVIRDRIEKLKYMAEKQVALSTDGTDRDVISYSVGPADICIQLLLIRNGKLTGKEHVITGLMGHEAEGNEASSMADAGTEIISEVGIAEILISFIKQFYSGGIFIPDEVLVEKTDGISEELPVLSGWLTGLKGSKATVKMPARGEKLKLIKMAKKHAEISLRQFEEKSAAEELQIKDGLDFIRALPGMEGNVSRIEAYDISNTGISEVTASMVVFTDGTPDKKEYRKFRISLNKAGQDDYAAMRNVLQRRLKQREEGKKMRSGIPSVIFVDGGAGHVAAACDALNEAGSAVPVFGMVKDAKHRTRGIVAPGGKEFRLEGNPAALRFISAVQDEAHRFALKYNIKLREKRVVRSELDNIRGIGPKKKKALIRHFGSVAAVRKAGIDDLEAVEGISRKDAERIFSYFSLLSSLENG